MILVIKLFKIYPVVEISFVTVESKKTACDKHLLKKYNACLFIHMVIAQRANDGVKNWIMIGEYTKRLIFGGECIST